MIVDKLLLIILKRRLGSITVDKLIYDALYQEAERLETLLWDLNAREEIIVDGTELCIHRVLSVFVAPQYRDGHWRMFMDLEYVDTEYTYKHKRGEFDNLTFGGSLDD